MSLPRLTERLSYLGTNTWASMAIFLLSFLVYLQTLAPGVYGFDSAELATGVYTQGIVHPPGYPLYLLAGKLFTFLPFGDIAYRLNIMSAFFASLTIVLLFLAMDFIVENRLAAMVSALLLGISNYFWQMALITEVYTFFTAFLAADLLIIGYWRRTGRSLYLLLFALFYGLTLTVHTSGILFAPGFAILVLWGTGWRKVPWRVLPVMLSLFASGIVIPYLYLAIRAGFHPALNYASAYPSVDLSSAQGMWWLISGKAYSIFAFGYGWSEIPAEALRFLAYLWRNFLGLGVILGLLGLLFLWHQQRAWAIGLGLIFLGNAVFYINYRVMDKDTMFLPAYEIWAIFIAISLARLQRWLRSLEMSSLLQRGISRAMSAALIVILLLGLNLNWPWVDMSGADGYIRFAKGMLAESEEGSVIIAPWSSAVVLEYYQLVEHQRSDLTIINRSRHNVARYYELAGQHLSHEQIMSQISSEEVRLINHAIREKTVYAVEFDPVLAKRFEYLPDGMVFRLAAP